MPLVLAYKYFPLKKIYFEWYFIELIQICNYNTKYYCTCIHIDYYNL